MTAVHAPPRVSVTLDGAPLADADAAALQSVRVRGRLSLPTQCELEFLAPSSALLQPGPRPGQALRVRVAGHEVPLFDGDLTAVEWTVGPSASRGLRLRGHDALHRLRKRQTVRAHVSTTVRELVEELVAVEGLPVVASADGPLWRHLLQHRSTDLGLLQELCERAGLYLALRDGAVHLLTLEGVGEVVELEVGRTLLDARLVVNGDPACRAVRAFGWDPLTGTDHAGEAATARSGRSAAATVDPASVGGTGLRTLVATVGQGPAHAQARAQAELDRASAEEVVLTGTCVGDPTLRPGSRVRVRGLGPAGDGTHVLTEVTHRVDGAHGHLCAFDTAAPPPRVAPGAPGAMLGVVCRVDDPDGLGRVRVTLPALGGVETDWLQVVCVGGSGPKGLMAVPDVDDRVVVLATDDQPGHGLVLGGLYGPGGMPDPGVVDGRSVRWTFATRAGQTVRVDDQARSVRLQDATGSYLELAPDGVRLHAAVPLTIEAAGQAVVVSGDTVDFRRR